MDFPTYIMPTQPKTMVIIDDEVDLRQLVAAFFRKRGWTVHEFGTLTEGLNGIETHEPAILFLDNNLPDGIGWEKAPQLASRFPDMQMNLISGYHPTPPSMPTGAHCQVLEKPFSLKGFEMLATG